MRDAERLKSEMFTRCAEFGTAEAASFPAQSLGGKLFTELNTVVGELNSHSAKQSSGKSSAGQGTTTKGDARDDVREDLEAISRTARAMAEELHGLEDKFRFPRGNSNDQELLALARAQQTDAVQYQAKFIEYGLPADFIADLTADIETFDAAVVAQLAGRREHVSATAAIEDEVQRGMTIARRLDAIVRNVFRDAPAKLAAWESTRHVERTARRKATGAGGSTPQP